MKKFAVFDIDGTLIRWQLYHATADQLVKLGYVEPRLYNSVTKARLAWKQRLKDANFKTYEAELIRVYERVLLGLDPKQVNKAYSAAFKEHKDQVYTYTRNLITELKKQGYLLFAISGSQQEIVKQIADYYQFDDFLGTVFEQNDGRFTGKSTGHFGAKHIALQGLIKKHGVTRAGSIAVGDSGGDITMLEQVEQPIAFNPDRELFEHAKKRGWRIVIERKNMVYELEQEDGRYSLVKTNAR